MRTLSARYMVKITDEIGGDDGSGIKSADDIMFEYPTMQVLEGRVCHYQSQFNVSTCKRYDLLQ